ncbi:MAG: energy transducer TonB [candidate division WOR-3 bacterium]
MAVRYEVVLPEEKKEKKWKIFVIFAISLLLHAGVLFLFRGQLMSALSEARLREIELMEEKLAQKKNVNPKAQKKLEEEKKKEEKKEEKKEGDNKPAGKMDLAPKLSTTLPNPNIKIGGPKLNMEMPQDLKIQIAQTQVLPEQLTVEKIDISQVQALQEMDAAIDIESLEPSMDLGAADMVIAISGTGASTSQILAMEAVPAVSLGGPGIEGALGGGLGFGEEGGGGGLGFGGGKGAINLAESGPGLAPSTDIKISSGSETFKAVEQQLGAASAGPKAAPMELTGEVANRKILNKVKPTYPEKARKEGWEGVVVLKFWVTPDGAVKNIQLVRSSGYPELDNSAKSALSQWRFAAKDVTVDEWGQLTVRFTLM